MVAAKASMAERAYIFRKINTALATMPGLAWARDRRYGDSVRTRASPTWWSTSWAQLLAAQLVGTVSGFIAAGVLLLIARVLHVLINAFGGRTFPGKDGELICFFTLCVKKA